MNDLSKSTLFNRSLSESDSLADVLPDLGEHPSKSRGG